MVIILNYKFSNNFVIFSFKLKTRRIYCFETSIEFYACLKYNNVILRITSVTYNYGLDFKTKCNLFCVLKDNANQVLNSIHIINISKVKTFILKFLRHFYYF